MNAGQDPRRKIPQNPYKIPHFRKNARRETQGLPRQKRHFASGVLKKGGAIWMLFVHHAGNINQQRRFVVRLVREGLVHEVREMAPKCRPDYEILIKDEF
ncbi:hypothetical protein ACFL45_08905 [Candidatus Neomarinimicrobiota bacterium]